MTIETAIKHIPIDSFVTIESQFKPIYYGLVCGIPQKIMGLECRVYEDFNRPYPVVIKVLP